MIDFFTCSENVVRDFFWQSFKTKPTKLQRFLSTQVWTPNKLGGADETKFWSPIHFPLQDVSTEIKKISQPLMLGKLTGIVHNSWINPVAEYTFTVQVNRVRTNSLPFNSLSNYFTDAAPALILASDAGAIPLPAKNAMVLINNGNPVDILSPYLTLSLFTNLAPSVARATLTAQITGWLVWIT